MKISNQTKIYIFTVLLFVTTFLSVTWLIRGFKNNDFDYIMIFANLLMAVVFVKKIIQLSKIENNK